MDVEEVKQVIMMMVEMAIMEVEKLRYDIMVNKRWHTKYTYGKLTRFPLVSA